jgi:hypothetical protein
LGGRDFEKEIRKGQGLEEIGLFLFECKERKWKECKASRL